MYNNFLKCFIHSSQQNGRLHNEITAMHTAVQERLGYLGRYKVQVG